MGEQSKVQDSWQQRCRDNWKHLRVPFQLTLAPLFLWGYFLSCAALRWKIVPAFIAFHFLLYTGITAFNSYYDRDEGPIGGLERPPAVRGSLLPLAIFLKVAGMLLALVGGRIFALIYLIFIVLSFLYSHPSTRWKAHPVLSALVVCIGQGALGFLAGWATARGEIGSAWTEVGVLGALSAALTTLGMYPLTQVFQIEEDSRRGDRTICVVLGAERSLLLSNIAFVLAGGAAVALAVRHYTLLDTIVLAGAYSFLFIYVSRFKRDYSSMRGSEAFRRVLFLNYTASGAFLLFICAHVFRNG